MTVPTDSQARPYDGWALEPVPLGRKHPLYRTVAEWVGFCYAPVVIATAVALGKALSFDRMARELMGALSQVRKRSSGNIKIAGFDDVEYAQTIHLTTVKQSLADIGTAAASAMLERVRRPEMPTRDILLDFQIVTRSSCCVEDSTGATCGSGIELPTRC